MELPLLEILSQDMEGVALAVSDLEGRITMTTPGLQKMLGRDLTSLSDEELDPFTMQDPHTGAALTLEDMPLVRACHGEIVRDLPLAMRRPDDRWIYVRCSAAPLWDDDGRIRGAITLVQDVTAEWTLTRKHDELRDRLVRTINHELRTPLTKILGHCGLLGELTARHGAELPEPIAHSLEVIERAGEEMAVLAQRVTDLADLEAATQIDVAACDLREVVAGEVEAPRTRRVGGRDDVEVVLEAPTRVDATVDAKHVAWAVRELLTNAERHAPAGSQVVVTLVPEDGHVVLTVADTGQGVPDADKLRLLRPFERGDSGDPSSSSPGLGLALVSAISAAHGGSVTLLDNEPQGLVVRVLMLRHLA